MKTRKLAPYNGQSAGILDFDGVFMSKSTAQHAIVLYEPLNQIKLDSLDQIVDLKNIFNNSTNWRTRYRYLRITKGTFCR